MHAGTLWINAWCRSMLISKDQIQNSTNFKRLTWPSESAPAIWVFLVGWLNRTWEIHNRTRWINAWCRSMLISKDQTSKIQQYSKDSHGHLSRPLPYEFSWLDGWTGPGRYITGHAGSMLNSDQCWSLTVWKKIIFRHLIEDHSIHSHCKPKISSEYQYSSISWHV